MEPLVHYSQRDPLYDPKVSSLANVHNDLTKPDDLATDNNHLNEHVQEHSPHYVERPVYIREPEPIIEIIIKESNVTLPPIPAPPVTPAPKKKEEVQVFYVKYKKNPHGQGKDSIIYDKPVPAISPPVKDDEEEQEKVSEHVEYPQPEYVTSAPPPSTTLRAIIKPESEVFHSNDGIHVTFGNEHGPKRDYDDANEESAPRPAISFPQGRQLNLNGPVQKRNPSIAPNQRLPSNYRTFNQPPPPQSPFRGPSNKGNIEFPGPNRPPPGFHSRPPGPPPPSYGGLQAQQTQNPFAQRQPVPYKPFDQIRPQPVINQVQFPRPQAHFPIQQQLPLVQQQFTFNQPNAPRQVNQLPPQLLPTPQIQNQIHAFHQQSFAHHQFAQQSANNVQLPQLNHQFPQQQFEQINQQFQHHQGNQQFQQQQLNQPLQQHNQQFNQQNQQLHQSNQQFNQQNQQLHQQSQQLHQQGQQLQQQAQNQHILQQNQQHQQQNHQHQPQNPQVLQQNQQFPQQNLQYTQHHQQFSQVNQQLQQQNQQLQQQNRPNFLNQQEQSIRNPQQINFEHHQQNVQFQHLVKNNQNLQQQQQQQQQPQQQSVIPPGGELVPSVSKYEQHISIPTFPQQQSALTDQFQQQAQQSQNYQQQEQQQQQQLNVNGLSAEEYQKRLQELAKTSFNTNSPAFHTTQRSFTYQPSPSPSSTTSTTTTTTRTTTTTTTESPATKDKAPLDIQLPDEVPDDLRQQLISSGILANAQISVLDYDKVGDIPLSALPPEQLANFYNAGGATQLTSGSNPIPSLVDKEGNPIKNEKLTKEIDDLKDDQEVAGSEIDEIKVNQPVEMKVVHFDPQTEQGKKVKDTYVKDDATQVEPVVLNDHKYTKYLPLKVSGSQFPIPDVPELKGKNINSVVVLAPVEYTTNEYSRIPRDVNKNIEEVKFISGPELKDLLDNPSKENFEKWLEFENKTSSEKQSVILLVTG